VSDGELLFWVDSATGTDYTVTQTIIEKIAKLAGATSMSSCQNYTASICTEGDDDRGYCPRFEDYPLCNLWDEINVQQFTGNFSDPEGATFNLHFEFKTFADAGDLTCDAFVEAGKELIDLVPGSNYFEAELDAAQDLAILACSVAGNFSELMDMMQDASANFTNLYTFFR